LANTGDRFEMPDGSVYEVAAAAADSAGGMSARAGLGRLLRPRTDV
jgi:hypothetical protein